MRPFAHALVFLIAAWVAAILLAPFVLFGESSVLALPAMVIYEIGERVCHQIDARSFHLDIYQLPVCARCTGLYVSAAAGAVAGLWGGVEHSCARARAASSSWPRVPPRSPGVSRRPVSRIRRTSCAPSPRCRSGTPRPGWW